MVDQFPSAVPVSLLFRKRIMWIYHIMLLWRIMNSTVNKWQVLHFLLLSIMYTSPYFCSIQQVMNANGLKKHFCRLAVSRKTPVSTEQKSCQFPPYPTLNYPEQDLRSPSQGCWLARKPVEPRSFTLILVQWDLPKLQALSWPHLEAKAIL